MAKESLRNRCTRCNELLHPDREVWLELDQRTNTYTDQGVPEAYSQGGFTFGKACAKRAKAEHSAKLGDVPVTS